MFLKGTFNKSNSIENVVMGFKWIFYCYLNIQEKMNRKKSKIILMAVSFSTTMKIFPIFRNVDTCNGNGAFAKLLH